jgi:hypothetical protein
MHALYGSFGTPPIFGRSRTLIGTPLQTESTLIVPPEF